MTIKFLYDQEFGLQIESDENNEELTEQQAMIVAVRGLASGMSALASALWEISTEFDVKKFYDEDAAHRAAPPAKKVAAAKRSSKKRRS
jgi:hypothetical protein